MLLSDKLALADGRPTGFDHLRLALAASVFLAHVFQINLPHGEAAVLLGWPRPFLACILPIFFALSGFLVAGSLLRTPRLRSFFKMRALRIVPALMVEVALSALVLGPAFTTLTLSDYFSDPHFRAYFLNIVGLVQYVLPGVFAGNPRPYVNEQLWTVPWELDCYILLGVLAASGLVRSRLATLVSFAGATALVAWHLLPNPPDDWVAVKGDVLILAFFAGVVVNLYADRIPHDARLAACAGVVMLGLLSVHHGEILVALPAAYVAAYLGALNLRRSRLVASGDYSYGMYLYGYPIQQAFATLWPGINWTAIPAFVLVCCVAAASWHLVERPFLKLRGGTRARFDRSAG